MLTSFAPLKLFTFKPAIHFLFCFCKQAILLVLDYRLLCFVAVIVVVVGFFFFFFWLMYRKGVIGHKGQTKCKSPFFLLNKYINNMVCSKIAL